MLPSPERLRQLFEFREVADEHSPTNIHLFWRVGKCAGRRAGFVHLRKGQRPYLYIWVDRRSYSAHRIIWSVFKGELILGQQIDHVDGNVRNNSLNNLRQCLPSENTRNQGARLNSTSGACGVHWVKDKQKWTAHINLGTFDSKSDAVVARDKATQFHFGEFARLNDPTNRVDPCLIGCWSID